MTSSSKTVYTLHIPVPPSGWLSSFEPETERLRLAEVWREAAAEALGGVDRSGWPTSPFARVVFCPQRIAEKGQVGLHVAESLRPTWHAVRAVLSDRGCHVFREELVFGKPDCDEAPEMRVEFSEGARRG